MRYWVKLDKFKQKFAFCKHLRFATMKVIQLIKRVEPSFNFFNNFRNNGDSDVQT